MLELPLWLDNLFMASALLSFLAFAVAWITFARLTMGRIERALIQDGLPRPSPWDGVGMRAPGFAFSIACPGHGWDDPGNPLIDVALVQRYAIKADRMRAWFFIATGSLFLLHVVLGGLVFDLRHYPD